MFNRLLFGDCLEVLRTLAPNSIQCCVTSPPYYGLRDYGHGGQIGLETTPAEYVAKLVEVFGEVHRVLAPDGTLWLNLGDSFVGGGGFSPNAPSNQPGMSRSGERGRQGALKQGGVKAQGVFKAKDLMQIPHRVSIALQDWGWYVRGDIIWEKPNAMPSPVKDRPSLSHENIFLLTKSPRYFYNGDDLREPASSPVRAREKKNGESVVDTKKRGSDSCCGVSSLTRNARSVWRFSTQAYPEAHFAVFPEELPKRCILAGSRPGDTILDPFAGSGTTGAVAARLGRGYVLIELNPEYKPLIEKRINAETAPLFTEQDFDAAPA